MAVIITTAQIVIGFTVWAPHRVKALANRAVTILTRLEDERRRRKNARRHFTRKWPPQPPRHKPGPAIQRPGNH